MRFCVRAVVALVLLIGLIGCGDGDAGGGPRIREFSEGMRWEPGFVSFYADESRGKVYLLLDESNRELLYQESLPRGVGSNAIGLDRGQLSDAGTALVRFEPAGDKVLFRRLNLRYRAESPNEAERRSVEEAFASSVLWGFPVVARDGGQLLVDATDFLLRDSHGVAERLDDMDEGQFKTDASRSAVYLPRSRAFPRNTELEAVVTLVGTDPGPQLQSVVPDPQAISVHMHHSFIALPEPGYQPRAFHPESGFWARGFADYAAAIDEPLEQRFIPRHRLARQNPDGPLGAPVKPITYYLDPATPEPVRSALMDGARWWNQAFESAGYKDAFRVELLPEGADPMDVRYNVIQWVHRSTRGWSYGSSVVDPRSGEIIKGHVTLGSLRVRQDLLIARGMTAPFAKGGDEDQLTSAMALARIRQLSAHEIGHTLGLAHNFAASIRDRASVMDYPHPRITLGDDGIVSLAGAYATGIGAWDRRTIRYGYAQFPDTRSEAAALAAQLEDNRREGFEFISDPDSRQLRDFHPRAHLWDDGTDPVLELNRVMAVRAAALARFGANNLPAGSPLSDLQEALVPVYLFHRYQVEAVAKLVGGADYRYALRGDDSGPAVKPVPAHRQLAALDALLATLDPAALELPAELLLQIPPKAYGYERNRESAPARTGALFDPLTLAESSAAHTLEALLHPQRLARLALQHSLDPEQLSPQQLFAKLQAAILLDEYEGFRGALDRRRAGVLLHSWRTLMAHEQAAPEVRASARAALLRALRLMKGRQRSSAEYVEFYAYERWLTERALERQDAIIDSKPPGLPPGSPIGSGR